MKKSILLSITSLAWSPLISGAAEPEVKPNLIYNATIHSGEKVFLLNPKEEELDHVFYLNIDGLWPQKSGGHLKIVRSALARLDKATQLYVFNAKQGQIKTSASDRSSLWKSDRELYNEVAKSHDQIVKISGPYKSATIIDLLKKAQPNLQVRLATVPEIQITGKDVYESRTKQLAGLTKSIGTKAESDRTFRYGLNNHLEALKESEMARYATTNQYSKPSRQAIAKRLKLKDAFRMKRIKEIAKKIATATTISDAEIDVLLKELKALKEPAQRMRVGC